MSFHPKTAIPRIGLLSLAVMATAMTGCSNLNLPSFSPFSLHEPAPKYVGLQPGFEADVSVSQQIYNKVREARAQNSIVLHVVGDDAIRVLPLPPGEKAVFVSDLLEQTGVQSKLGALDAVLYRHSPNAIGGVPMEVQMSSDKRSVRAVSDYALQAGDRLRVEKAPYPGLEKLIKSTIGL